MRNSTPGFKRPRSLAPAIVIVVALALGVIVVIVLSNPYGEPDKSISREPQLAVPPLAPTPTPTRNFTSNTPSTKVIIAPPSDVAPEPPKTPSYEVRYVGRADWTVYHRLTCKYARRIDPANLVTFPSAAAARAAGYTPCKICNPPEDDAHDTGEPSIAVAPTTVVPKHAPIPTTNAPVPPAHAPVASAPVAPPALPVPVTFTLAPIDYPYTVVERTPSHEEGFIRVDYIVDVDRRLKPDEAVNLAKKLVADETAKTSVQAISFIIRRKTVPGQREGKWEIWIDWAPDGSMSKASDSRPGDYHNHKFYTVLELAK